MKHSKRSFSKIQKQFQKEFDLRLKAEGRGGQHAMVELFGCDRCSVSRWANRENAPPSYVCRLLLKKLGSGSFKQALGRRIRYLREEIYKISLREFAWTLNTESISQLEAVEHGEVELPRHCMETLMRDYQIQAGYLDYGEKVLFADTMLRSETVLAYLKEGFKLHIVTAPRGNEDRSRLKCKFVLQRQREHLPQCFVATATGSFNSSGGGLINIENALWALMMNAQTSLISAPAVLTADVKEWKEIHESRFYRTEVAFRARSKDVECEEKLGEILATVSERFDECCRKRSVTIRPKG